MKKILIEIKNRFTGTVLFSYESEDNTIAKTVSEAVKSEANLSKADLSGANLSWANLSIIKHDLWDVLLHGIKEIPFLKKKIIEGKIDGTSYDGECACLNGTLENSAKENNGEMMDKKIRGIRDCRNPDRPIERFFLAIRIGGAPENNQVAKMVLAWIEEFENYLK